MFRRASAGDKRDARHFLFGARQAQYEKFYAGNSIIVRNQSDREAPWEKFHGIVDSLLDAVPMPDETTDGAGAKRG